MMCPNWNQQIMIFPRWIYWQKEISSPLNVHSKYHLIDMLKVNFGPDSIPYAILILDFKIIFYNNSTSNEVKYWRTIF